MRIVVDKKAPVDAGKNPTTDRGDVELLAYLSHEMRTPISAMMGFASLMMTEDLPPEQNRRYAATIFRSCQTLIGMINQTLDFASLRSKTVELDLEPVNLRSLASELEGLFKAQALHQGIDLAFTLAPNVPTIARLDALRLRQVVTNIVGNALKFTERGSVSCHWQISRKSLEITVTDTGPGIAPDERELLFRPFQQANRAVRQRYGGSGLGLCLARMLARAMGGDVILVASEPGQGSRFSITVSL